MSYTFYLPCDPDNIVMVTITDNGDMVFDDPEVVEEIEKILISLEMGFNMPDMEEFNPCVRAYFVWIENPFEFICSSGAISLEDAGYVATFWAKSAIDYYHRGLPKDEYFAANLAIKRIRAYFIGRSIHYRRILDEKRAIYDIIDSYKSYEYGSLTFSSEGHAFRCVAALQDVVTMIEQQRTTLGYVDDVSCELCAVYLILEESLMIDSNRKQEEATSIMMDTTIKALSSIQKIKEKRP